MHTPFGNHFAIKMRQLFLKPDVLHQHGTARSGGQHMVVVSNGRACAGGKTIILVCHDDSLLDVVCSLKAVTGKPGCRVVETIMAENSLIVNNNYYY